MQTSSVQIQWYIPDVVDAILVYVYASTKYKALVKLDVIMKFTTE